MQKSTEQLRQELADYKRRVREDQNDIAMMVDTLAFTRAQLAESKDETYNGWTNYATWRVNLEIFDGFDTDGVEYDADMCEDFVETILFEEQEVSPLLMGYAGAFLADVNWHEIADAINERNEEVA